MQLVMLEAAMLTQSSSVGIDDGGKVDLDKVAYKHHDPACNQNLLGGCMTILLNQALLLLVGYHDRAAAAVAVIQVLLAFVNDAVLLDQHKDPYRTG